jgi:NAD(P)-dependent dehydrogenase (short-subunit alcohol dehydrogenase family)
MARPLNEQVVVLTGASSGIGRATAVELGRRGATVVLAARSEESLGDVAREVHAAGGRAVVAPTDVADRSQVDRLAQTAVSHFGRIDTWINNAAVSQYATVENTTAEEIERIIRVNLLGVIYGCKAALPVLKRQNDGTIVNVASVLGRFSVPLLAAYCASKHGIIGFADSLRLELKREGSRVEVATVMPGSTNTPLFDHARAKLGGKAPMPLPPVYEPSAVAHAIAHVCEYPQRDVVIGLAGKLFILMHRIHSGLIDWMMLMNDSGVQLQTSDRPDKGRDNLTAPTGGVQPARGSYGDRWWNLGESEYTRVFELHPALRYAAIGAAAFAAVGLLGWLTGRPHGSGDGRWAGKPDPTPASVPEAVHSPVL